MADYNDGKWHGWNGGECPVDPNAEIEIRWANPAEDATNHSGKASHWDARCWGEAPIFGQIIAFRVTKPAPPKPREWWINTISHAMIRAEDGSRPAHGADGWVHVIEKLPD